MPALFVAVASDSHRSPILSRRTRVHIEDREIAELPITGVSSTQVCVGPRLRALTQIDGLPFGTAKTCACGETSIENKTTTVPEAMNPDQLNSAAPAALYSGQFFMWSAHGSHLVGAESAGLQCNEKRNARRTARRTLDIQQHFVRRAPRKRLHLKHLRRSRSRLRYWQVSCK